MIDARLVPVVVVWLSWLFFGAVFVIHHARTRMLRGPETATSQDGEFRAPESMIGLVLEGVAIFIVFTFRHTEGFRPFWLLVLAAAIAVGASLFAAAALRHLGMQWRVKAVVTRDHSLVTTGPYSVVRHPIYLALFGMTFASGLVLTVWPFLVLSTAIYLIGTEIRVRARTGFSI